MAGQGEACRGCATADVLRDRIAELEAALLQMTDKFCDFAHNSGMMIEDPETHDEVIRSRELIKNT